MKNIDTTGMIAPVVRRVASSSSTMKTMPTTIGPALSRWRARYPSHPANDVVRSDIEMIDAPQALERVSHVALLLPVSGRQAAAAAQIRDGFFTAYYSSPAGTRSTRWPS